MKRRIGVIVALGLTMLAGIAISGVPSHSQQDLDSRLRDFGMPAGAELVAAQQGENGELMTVYHRDTAGQVNVLGNIAPSETPTPSR